MGLRRFESCRWLTGLEDKVGSDLNHLQREASHMRGARYVRLKTMLCRVLGLKCRFDKHGPGEYDGVTDDELIDAVVELQEEARHEQ